MTRALIQNRIKISWSTQLICYSNKRSRWAKICTQQKLSIKNWFKNQGIRGSHFIRKKTFIKLHFTGVIKKSDLCLIPPPHRQCLFRPTNYDLLCRILLRTVRYCLRLLLELRLHQRASHGQVGLQDKASIGLGAQTGTLYVNT